MNSKFLMFLSILVIYFVVDVAYQVSIGLKLVGSLYEAAGVSDVFSSEPQHLATIPLFFVVMAFVLLRVVVLPAIEKKDVLQAFLNGALVGIASYGTLALVLLWQIVGFPVAAVFAILLEGLLFPTISSGVTAWWFLRKRKN